jgi:hypothetical protein
MNIYNKDRAGLSADEVGYAGYGHTNLIVSQLRIDLYFDTETNRTRQMVCALAAAHEMGHVFLGSFHQTGSATNIMTDKISNVLPLLRVATMPSFTAAQGDDIRAYLGY